MPLYIETEFSAQAVRPMECIKAGWDLIKDDYWLFFGISLVAILIGQLAPAGLLMAPMTCGVYFVLLQRLRGEAIEFGDVFKGFDYLGQSLIALLAHMIPALAILIPAVTILLLAGMAAASAGEASSAGAILVVFVAVIVLLVIAVVVVVSILFTFTYPLIVDRRLSGIEAVRLSMKAGFGNFSGLFSLILLNVLMGIGGLLCCYVGIFFVMPIGFAATAIAYRQVFGLATPETFNQGPPPPPRFT